MAGNQPVDTPCNYDRQQEAACVQEGELPARKLIQPLVHGPPSFQKEDRREPLDPGHQSSLLRAGPLLPRHNAMSLGASRRTRMPKITNIITTIMPRVMGI
jgi:hypothetical protein